MYAISPKSTSIHFFDNDEYSEIDNLFKMEHGERYIEKQSLEELPEVDSIISILKRNNILEEDGERYYVVGHMLKNLEIKKNNKAISPPT